MPRQRTTTLSKRRLQGYTRDQLFSEIDSITSTPHLDISWGSIFSGHLASPVLDDLSDLQRALEDVRNDKLIDCVLALRSALESAHECTTMPLRRNTRRKQRSRFEIRGTTREVWLRARERRTHVILQSSSWSGAQHGNDDDAIRQKLQDAQDLAAKYRDENEALRVRLQNREQESEQHEHQLWMTKADLQQMAIAHEKTNTELINSRQQVKVQEMALGRLQTDLDRALETETFNQSALHEKGIEMWQTETALTTMTESLQLCEAQRDELRAQRDGLEMALRIAKNDWKNAQCQLAEALSAVSQQQRNSSEVPGGVGADAITCWTDETFTSDNTSPSPCSSAQGSASLHSSPISEYTQNVQVCQGSEHPIYVTNSHEMNGDKISMAAGLPPQCCDEAPVARTNAGCELCPDHCEQFTWYSQAEMGRHRRPGVTPCPACNGPRCESAELLSQFWMN
ncbi:hypothetical protein H2200_007529 [Cladophialophora chaetospira]|uniref:Uncharacterized protein n=1 Tax=Cladophialophora chaetospira TaxID=386627 RepID=A0AA38X834_9EURO|nr:hypothetical protein H2200_007529 [Cladophialophora chaetospira]